MMDTGAIIAIGGIVLTAAVGTWVKLVVNKINGAPSHEDFRDLKKEVKEAIKEGNGGRKELWIEIGKLRENMAVLNARINGGTR